MKKHVTEPAGLAERFQHFQKLLGNNTAIMERIATLERAQGGEFIFDRAFIVQAASDLIRLVREVIYSVNVLSGNRFNRLYDKLETIAAHITAIARGSAGTQEEQRLLITLRELHRDLDTVAGGKAAILGEIGNHLKIPVPDGFVLTTTAYALFMEHNGLFQQFEDICQHTKNLAERAGRMTELLQTAAFPMAFREAVAEGLKDLHKRIGRDKLLAVRSSAVGEDGPRSFAGQFKSELDVAPDTESVLAACRRVLAARFSGQALDYAGDIGPRALPMAIAVQEMIPARISGILHSRAPWRGTERILVTAVDGLAAHLTGGTQAGHHFVLERRNPFSLVESEFAQEKHEDAPINDSVTSRSSPLSLSLLRQFAEIALLLEKSLDGPQEIEWACEGETVVILQSRPFTAMAAATPPPPVEVAADLRKATILLGGRGHVAQIGIASGPVVRVSSEDDPVHFPVGAIAVAREASPALSPIARKAAAIITDVGGPTGHLAAICREYRTPALFGTREATRALHTGTEVTVDVEERTVYKGLVPGLLRLAAARQDPYPLSEESATLRRLLRRVAPLSLTDPNVPEFNPEHCRTLHDIIRFCHEKAVESLINIQADNIAPPHASLTLKAPIPLRLHLIDLGGGLPDSVPKQGSVTPAQVTSRPFAALLCGLLKKFAWEREPAPFSLKDLFSSMTKPLTSRLIAPYNGDNLAIIAESYCNLTLRLGYHFNVIDAYLSQRSEENNIYFRFVGGFATEEKRLRRARFIAAVLTGLHFRVEQTGDLLVARARMLDPAEMPRTLTRLGELVSFTRQLDVRMVDDEAAERAFERFIDLLECEEQG